MPLQFAAYGRGQQAAYAGDPVFPASAETAACQYRAPLGSFERFCGILIEHFVAVPISIVALWLAPEQIRILTVSEKFGEYGRILIRKRTGYLRRKRIRYNGETDAANCQMLCKDCNRRKAGK